MSAGRFTRSRYAAEYTAGAIHPVRVQPESVAASIGGTTNAPPAGAATNPISAKVSGGRRELGLRARRVTMSAPTTTPPTGYLAGGLTTIPALNLAFYNAAVKGAVCSYLGVSFEVVSRSAEVVL